ncbi:MAG TPA: CPBP family intramembrane glutamic endopeptidase [Rhizomicrobium sp.]|nr:CPBP family intramembrane glutamic endopeptidase [Rhizomicrobium sp.]
MAQSRNENRILIVIGLLIALGLPFSHLSSWGKAHSGLGPLWGGEVFWLALFLLIVVYVLVVERKSLSSIGFRSVTPMAIPIAIAAAFVIAAGDVVISSVEAVFHLAVKTQINALFLTPLWFRFYLAARAAIVEETAFRGYGFERLTDLTGSKWLAALVTFALFTAAHYPGGGLALALVAAWGGLVLTLLYLWRRNIWTTIIAHWLTDLVGLVLVPAMGLHH